MNAEVIVISDDDDDVAGDVEGVMGAQEDYLAQHEAVS